MMMWPTAELIESQRLRLVPLAVEHAHQMVHVLDHPSLYQYTGGDPPTPEQLHRRYAAQIVGRSPDGTEGWLNWVIALHRCPARLVGYVQATVTGHGDAWEADVAWVVSSDHQGQGIATEAADAMVQWLKASGVAHFVAYIAPEHDASRRVAQNVGLYPTDFVADGEVRWLC